MKSGEELIPFIARYRMATTQALMAALNDASPKSIERALSRRLQAGKLVSFPLRGPMKYYTLSVEMSTQLGLHDGRCGMALGYQSLCQNYAMMASCVLSDIPKVRLNRDEFAAKLPMLLHDGQLPKHYRTRYFIDSSQRDAGVVRVGLFIVDHGQHLRRLVRKVRREIEKRREGPFATLVAKNLLIPYVLTAFPQKAAQIQTALARESFSYRVETVPGYDAIL
jgi:hypothetical protein